MMWTATQSGVERFTERLELLSALRPELYAKGVRLIRLLLEEALRALEGGSSSLREIALSAGVEAEELSALLSALFD